MIHKIETNDHYLKIDYNDQLVIGNYFFSLLIEGFTSMPQLTLEPILRVRPDLKLKKNSRA